MNHLLIQNISLFNESDLLVKKDILITGNLISSITEPFSIKHSEIRVEIIDGTDFLVLPGLMNCHSHIPMILFRGLAEDLNLFDWLNKKIFPYESKLTDELVLYGSLLGIAELIHTGCTYFADMYFFMESVAKAVEISGIRANLSLGLVDKNGSDGINKAKDFFLKYHGQSNGRIEIFFGPHAPYTCNLDFLKKVSDLAKSLNTGIHIHLNETEKEVMDFKETHNKLPIVALQDIGFFGTPVICAHCVHMSPEEMMILKNENALVVHNPSSNMKLGSGIAPIETMLQKGLKVSLGTDGAASNNHLNMFGEMHLASLLAKVNAKNGSVLSANTILKMGTEIPGKYLLNGEVGTIDKGSSADLILISLNEPSLFPNDMITKSFIHSMYGTEVDTMIVNGKIIMKQKEILTMDENEIRTKANKLVRKTNLC